MFLTPVVLNCSESPLPGMESQFPDVFLYVLAPLPFQLRCAACAVVAARTAHSAAMRNANLRVTATSILLPFSLTAIP
jgi:hypothetical protein